jgi:hypothetical protein
MDTGKRQELWYQVVVEVLRKNGKDGTAETAIAEANKVLEAYDKIAPK